MTTTGKFIIKPYGKSELAAMYNWHIKTLKRKMCFCGLDWPPDNVFTPKQVASIVDALGVPYGIYEEN
ncbi:MAG: hypothetical protein U0X91_03560 [Spirosomataceae bacterium]